MPALGTTRTCSNSRLLTRIRHSPPPTDTHTRRLPTLVRVLPRAACSSGQLSCDRSHHRHSQHRRHPPAHPDARTHCRLFLRPGTLARCGSCGSEIVWATRSAPPRAQASNLHSQPRRPRDSARRTFAASANLAGPSSSTRRSRPAQASASTAASASGRPCTRTAVGALHAPGGRPPVSVRRPWCSKQDEAAELRLNTQSTIIIMLTACKIVGRMHVPAGFDRSS